MNSRAVAVIFVALMAILAGCAGGGGTGGGTDDPASVSIVDPGGIAAAATPGDNVTVEAEASGGTVDRLNLSYTVYNRSNVVVSSDRVRMTQNDDGDYSATIPGQPVGYRVEYEVRGYFADGSQASDSNEYTVQLIKSLSNPEGTTENERSTLSTTLYSTESVQKVTFSITKRVQSSAVTVTEQRTITDVRSANLSVTSENTVFGAGASDINVSYNVTVVYGEDGENLTVTSQTRSYLYRNTAEKVLYVPVTFEGGPNTEPEVRSTLTEKATKPRSTTLSRAVVRKPSRVNG